MKKNDVGYKKPPKASQWKPGQSGNPSGKSKSQPPKLLLTEMAAQLYEPVPIRDNGKVRMMPFSKAFTKSFYRDLAVAPFKEKLLALEKLEKWGVLSAREILHADNDHEPPLLSENDRRLLDILRKDVGIEDDGPTSPGW